MRLFQTTNIPFVKIRYTAYIISAILIIAGIVGLFARGLNWSIDFTGGMAATVNLTPAKAGVAPLPIDKLRSTMKDNGFPDAEVQRIGEMDKATFLIKIKSTKDLDETKADLLNILTTKLPDYIEGRDIENDLIEQMDVVGKKAGSEMQTNAILAIVIALILMVLYIWIRFEFTFGLMAIVALFHDVSIIVGIFALTGKEVTIQIIAALLTIVGYSINDTIVIYDRIREDLKVYRKDPIPDVFNRAINRTLSRTTITAGTTLLTSLALYFFGGTVLHDFAFAMSLGIFFGTYSSIFVASNLVIDTYGVTHKEKQSIQHLTKKK
jgi:preprotein translocase SecF subunit